MVSCLLAVEDTPEKYRMLLGGLVSGQLSAGIRRGDNTNRLQCRWNDWSMIGYYMLNIGDVLILMDKERTSIQDLISEGEVKYMK